jgi:hypothetical protein
MSSQRPLLVDTGRGLTIKYRDRLLYSSVDPRRAAVRRAQRAPLAEKTLIFVPSLGLGYGLAELLARLPAGCHVLCVESNQQLMRCALDCSAAALPTDERLTIIRAESPRAAARFLQDLGAWRFRRVTPLYLCRAWELDRETYARMLAVLESGVRVYWQNRLTLTRMARLWVRNLFANIHRLGGEGRRREVRDLSALRTEKAVLVAGAGPSLEESLSWINRRRGELFVLSVDTALPVLLDSGISPDAVFMLEAQLANLQDFLPYPGVFLPLVCDLTASPQVIRRLSGNSLYFYSSRFYPLSLFERLRSHHLLPTPIDPLGSVGVAAVSAALAISGGPVLLTGLDFSYLDGKTHARGAPFNRLMYQNAFRYRPAGMKSFQAVQDRPLLRLTGKNGRPVLSDLVLQGYALKLQEIIAGSGRVFDLSARGLPSGARPLAPAGAGKAASIPALPAAIPPQPVGGDFRPTSQRVTAFLFGEEKLLASAASGCLAALNSGLEASAESGDLQEKLKRVEYAYLDFPDFSPGMRLSAALLARLAPAIEDVRRRLEATSSL